MINFEIKNNEQYKSTEILFDGKPSEQIREILKANGYRWHGVRRVWYGYKKAEEIAEILQAVENGQPIPHATAEKNREHENSDREREQKEKENQARLWAKIAEMWQDSEKWLEYYKKDTAYLIELESGEIISIEKPRIETRFCFGYGQNGVSTEEDYERAENMAEYANREQSYFLKENLKGLKEQIAELKGEKTKYGYEYDAYRYKAYYYDDGRNGKTTIAKVKNYSDSDIINWADRYNGINVSDLTVDECAEKMHYKKLTEADTEKYLYYLEKTLADFEKRLNTYLKKYGTSKLTCWSYLVD